MSTNASRQRRRLLLATMALAATALAGPALAQPAWPTSRSASWSVSRAARPPTSPARALAETLAKSLGPAGGGREQARCLGQHRRRSGRQGHRRSHAGRRHQRQPDLRPGCSTPSSPTTRRRTSVSSLLATAPLVLVAPPDLPSGAEFFAAARTSGGKWSYGSVGIGSVGHLGMEYVKAQAGNFEAVHVPYNGNPAVITAIIGGQIHAALMPPGMALPQVKAGKLKAIGLDRPAQRDGARHPVAAPKPA